VTRVVKDFDPVTPGVAEAEWHKDQVTAQMRESDPEWTWGDVEMPAAKPAFSDLVPDDSGRVWVERPGVGVEDTACVRDPETMVWEPDCWTDSHFYDVFDLEGRFLGTIETPERLRITVNAYIQGDEIIAQLEDEMGVITIKRYQIVTPN